MPTEAELTREALTPARRRELRAERAALPAAFDRIAFDNVWTGFGVPLGAVLMAFEADDSTEAAVDLVVDNIDGFGPRGGRWWGVFADGVLLETGGRLKARAERIAEVYRQNPALMVRKLTERPGERSAPELALLAKLTPKEGAVR